MKRKVLKLYICKDLGENMNDMKVGELYEFVYYF